MNRQYFVFIMALVLWGGSTFIMSGQTISYSDGFEGASLNPFWTASTTYGAIITVPSTEQAHSGSQSVQFNSPRTEPGDGYATLTHTFATPVYGQMSVWLYEPVGNEFDIK